MSVSCLEEGNVWRKMKDVLHTEGGVRLSSIVFPQMFWLGTVLPCGRIRIRFVLL